MPTPLSLPFSAVFACLALGTIATPVALAATHQAPAADAADAALHLTIAGPEADPELAGLLQVPVEAMLAERGYRLEPSAPRGIFLIVHVDETAADTHEIEVRLEHDGNTTFYPTTRCVRCGSKDLLETIERALEPAFVELDAGGPAAPPEPAADIESSAETERKTPSEPAPVRPALQPPPPASDADPDRLGRKGIAGVALLSAGLTGTAAGAALWASKESDHPTRPDMILRLKPPGITLVAVGSAATVSGIVLLALDRQQARARATAAAPMLGPGLAGLSVTGRF